MSATQRTGATLPLGKLPPDLLASLLSRLKPEDPRVLYGPGIGRDCAVIDLGERALVLKSDPITFATAEIGWYAVQINANDIASTGSLPRWMLATLLLPENRTTQAQVKQIFTQLEKAASDAGIAIIGGHTEITLGLERPILVAAMLGEIEKEKLVLPDGARPGDRLLLTKGIPIEATALLAREFPERLAAALSPEEIREAQNYLYSPGISVLKDAQIAVSSGKVTAMHDPTEGGLASALWELSEACGKRLRFEARSVIIPPLAERVCAVFGLNPLAAIASGALLLAADPGSTRGIIGALEREGIACGEIGAVEAGPPGVVTPAGDSLPRPPRDEITRVFGA